MANDLLKQAIADAKAVRETALANAKLALEEAFTPRIQSMLSNRIAEEEEMEETKDSEMEEGMHGDDEKNEGMHGDKEMEEGMHGDKDEMKEEEGMEAPVEAPAEEAPAMEEEEDLDEMELEAIIKELEEEMEEVDEDLDSSEIGAGDNKVDLDATSTEDPGEGDLYEGEEVDLEEVIKALREMEEGEDKMEEGEDKMEEAEEMEEGEGKGDLEEAYEVIRFLRSKINEVNLLNAKLLFSNKLFRNHSLNESQKLKVIENFDRASNIREVKLIYSTLAESFGSGKVAKRKLKESYASKASASTAPKKVLTEGNELAARWNKLITYNR